MRLPPNWRDRLVIEDYSASSCHVFTLKFQRGLTPRGFMRCVGELLVDIKPPYIVDESMVVKYFHGRGLGMLLYSTALHRFGMLSTNFHSASQRHKGFGCSSLRNIHLKQIFSEGV